MKTMLMSDFVMLKSLFLRQILISLFVGVFVGMACESWAVGLTVTSYSMVFSLAFSLYAYDDLQGYQAFRLSLPQSRTNIIAGRYVSMFLLALLGIVPGLAAVGIAALLAQAMPTTEPLLRMMTDFSWESLGVVCALSLALFLLMFTLVTPFIVRFGCTKAMRIIPVVIILLMLVIMAGQESFSTLPSVQTIEQMILSPIGIVTILVVTLGLYAISCVIANKLYATHDL